MSLSMKSAFEKYCTQFSMESKKIVIDVRHKWNSTYLLIKSYECYEALITKFYKLGHTIKSKSNGSNHKSG